MRILVLLFVSPFSSLQPQITGHTSLTSSFSIVHCRDVIMASSLFHLTEDGCGVLWQHPSSQQWSSDESDTGWDSCNEDQAADESKTTVSAWVEPENWEDEESCPSRDAHGLHAETETEVCWDPTNDYNCKLWNGKDWTELEDSGAQEEFEEEYSTNVHFREIATVPQENDGSLGSDDNDIDDLVWITENSN